MIHSQKALFGTKVFKTFENFTILLWQDLGSPTLLVPKLPPTLINFSKFLHPGHAYSNPPLVIFESRQKFFRRLWVFLNRIRLLGPSVWVCMCAPENSRLQYFVWATVLGLSYLVAIEKFPCSRRERETFTSTFYLPCGAPDREYWPCSPRFQSTSAHFNNMSSAFDEIQCCSLIGYSKQSCEIVV